MAKAASNKTAAKPKPDHADTRCRILDSAERLFADRGIDAVSIRDITRAAKVNLAAVNYHFRTKQGLVAEVFARRLKPVNEKRLELLSRVEATAGAGVPAVKAVVEALVRPVVEAGFDAQQQDEHFMRLMGRCMSEANEETYDMIHSYYEEVIRRFDAAFLRALPFLNPDEIFWRVKFTIGSIHHALLACGMAERMPDKVRRRLDAEGVTKRLVSFATAGWLSPLPG